MQGAVLSEFSKSSYVQRPTKPKGGALISLQKPASPTTSLRSTPILKEIAPGHRKRSVPMLACPTCTFANCERNFLGLIKNVVPTNRVLETYSRNGSRALALSLPAQALFP